MINSTLGNPASPCSLRGLYVIAYTYNWRPIMSHSAYPGNALRQTMSAVIVCALLGSCANTPGDEINYTDRPHYCRSGETPSCIEKVGKPVRCFCADKDALRELLDPNY